MKNAAFAAFALVAFASHPAIAQTGHSGHDHHAAPAAPTAQKNAAPAEGTVRKVDREAGKITIAHGPLENLGMPAMTMVFKVGEAAMLDGVKAGDKVRFVADRVQGTFTVTKLEAVR